MNKNNSLGVVSLYMSGMGFWLSGVMSKWVFFLLVLCPVGFCLVTKADTPQFQPSPVNDLEVLVRFHEMKDLT